jgi:hypothetical protein
MIHRIIAIIFFSGGKNARGCYPSVAHSNGCGGGTLEADLLRRPLVKDQQYCTAKIMIDMITIEMCITRSKKTGSARRKGWKGAPWQQTT